MYTVEELEKKVAQIASNVESSAANHHILLGTKLVWESLLAEARKDAAAVKAEQVVAEPETPAAPNEVQAPAS